MGVLQVRILMTFKPKRIPTTCTRTGNMIALHLWEVPKRQNFGYCSQPGCSRTGYGPAQLGQQSTNCFTRDIAPRLFINATSTVPYITDIKLSLKYNGKAKDNIAYGTLRAKILGN